MIEEGPENGDKIVGLPKSEAAPYRPDLDELNALINRLLSNPASGKQPLTQEDSSALRDAQATLRSLLERIQISPNDSGIVRDIQDFNLQLATTHLYRYLTEDELKKIDWVYS